MTIMSKWEDHEPVWSTVEGKYQRTIEIRDYVEKDNTAECKTTEQSNNDIIIPNISKK